jgi:LPXTG-site transpeptidase (sortase) family protein
MNLIVVRNNLLSMLVALVILLSGPVSAAADDGPSSIPAQDSTYFVPVTGQTISADMLAYWTTTDGAELLGMPVTAPSKSGTQIFQFGAVRLTADGDLVRDDAGAKLVRLKYAPATQGNSRRHAPSSPTSAFKRLEQAPGGSSVIFDDRTDHSIKGGFARAYTGLGGQEMLGSPISEAYAYGPNRVQWFENGQLVEDASGVHPGSIGIDLATRSGRSTKPKKPSHRPVFLDRFQPTNGDGTVADAPTVFAPVAIQIPSIGVDANVEDVPIIDGVMQTPQDVWAVGWYYDLPAPGQFTNVVMAAHRDWWGVGPVVFYDLGSVTEGDMIYLWDADGNGATYQVTEVQIVDAEINAADVVSDKNADTLTLITCGGDFDGEHYLSRVIVQAVRV